MRGLYLKRYLSLLALLSLCLLCYWLCNDYWLWSRSQFASAGNNFLERLSWEEANFLARLDLDRFASERVTSLASFAINFLELSKVVDGYIFALLDVAHD